MLIPIAFVVIVLVGGFFAFIGTRPDHFRIERSAEIAAPGGVVFSLINDFHPWADWSPWEKIDPNMKKTFEGPSAGPGAVYSWTGDKKVGAGRMTIIESRIGEFVSINLEFFRPFKATNQTKFILAPTPVGTHVNWSMDGKNNFMGKAFSLVMNMDAMVGKDFERGLANLDTAAQAEAKRICRVATNG